MKKDELIKKINKIQYQLYEERANRHKDIKQESENRHQDMIIVWNEKNDFDKKVYNMNILISLQRTDIDNLLQRIYILEEQLKKVIG